MSEWHADLVECRICGRQQASMYQQGTDVTNLQCHHCHNMSCQPVEEGELYADSSEQDEAGS